MIFFGKVSPLHPVKKHVPVPLTPGTFFSIQKQNIYKSSGLSSKETAKTSKKYPKNLFSLSGTKRGNKRDYVLKVFTERARDVVGRFLELHDEMKN